MASMLNKNFENMGQDPLANSYLQVGTVLRNPSLGFSTQDKTDLMRAFAKDPNSMHMFLGCGDGEDLETQKAYGRSIINGLREERVHMQE